MDLGSVRVKIEGDSTKLQADLKAAEVAAANAGGKIAQTFNKSAGSMNNTTATIKQVASGITQTGEAAEKAGKKVQSFVGAIPGMGVAAERFIGLIPGLGQAMIAAFPVFGAVAFAAGLGRVAEGVRDIANEWDPVISAEKRAKEGAEEFGKTIVKIREELAKMANVRFAGAVGKAGGQADEAAQLESQKRLLQSQIQATKDEIARTAAAGAAGAGTMAVAGNFIPGMDTLGNRFTKGAKIDVATQTQKLVEFQNQLRQVEEQQSDLSVASLQAQSDKIDTARDKEQSKAERRAESDFAIREQRQREYESQLKAAEAAGDKEIAAKKHFNDAMAEQQQRWKKINIDAKDQRVTQSKIDVPVASRISGPLAGALELKDAGIQTAQMQQAQIAEDQRLLNMSEQMNVPLGTQLQLREQILQKQIDLKAAQGQSVSAELQALDALQAQMDRMHQKAAGIAPLLHNLRGIGGQIPGQLGGALAGGLVGGNPGKGIGQEIRGALQGIGQQILGTVFQAAIQQLVVSLGINTLANTVLQALFGVQQASTAGLIASQTANTAALVANTTAVGAQAVTGGVGAAAGIAGSAASAASGGLLGSVISGAISAAGSLVSAFLIIRAIHGTTAEVRALQRSGGIKPGGDGISGANAEKPAQAGYMSSLAKIFGADAVRVNIVAISPLAFTNGVFGLIGNLFGFADGGRPPLGRPSIVGERGPELFIPDQAGRIIANGGSGLSFPVASSNGGGITIGSITANGVNNPREFVREVARQLPAYLKSTNPKYSPASR